MIVYKKIKNFVFVMVITKYIIVILVKIMVNTFIKNACDDLDYDNFIIFFLFNLHI